MTEKPRQPELLALVARMVCAQAATGAVDFEALPETIRSVYETLARLGNTSAAAAEVKPPPAVPLRKSVFPGYIICLEDGRKHVTLRRYLSSQNGSSPDQYRERWGLPSDYPWCARVCLETIEPCEGCRSRP